LISEDRYGRKVGQRSWAEGVEIFGKGEFDVDEVICVSEVEEATHFDGWCEFKDTTGYHQILLTRH
jgi:hypothetical protein